ncbi:MAG: hypothetical protein WC485_03305 [Opitutaceae bacterium]
MSPNIFEIQTHPRRRTGAPGGKPALRTGRMIWSVRRPFRALLQTLRLPETSGRPEDAPPGCPTRAKTPIETREFPSWRPFSPRF